MNKKLVLASSSPYRAELLSRFGLEFETFAPDADETPLPSEPAVELVLRLAELKANIGLKRYPGAIIISSDQTAVVDNRMLGKPGTHAKAVEQLTLLSGKHVIFHTSLCVIDATKTKTWLECVQYHVYFRQLTQPQIKRYVDYEKPYQCAGSFKSESYGVTLFERMQGDDPTALMGLPLIRLCNILNEIGIDLP